MAESWLWKISDGNHWESLNTAKYVTVNKIYSQIIQMRADVFLEEAVVEPAVQRFVSKSVVYVIGSHRECGSFNWKMYGHSL